MNPSYRLNITTLDPINLDLERSRLQAQYESELSLARMFRGDALCETRTENEFGSNHIESRQTWACAHEHVQRARIIKRKLSAFNHIPPARLTELVARGRR